MDSHNRSLEQQRFFVELWHVKMQLAGHPGFDTVRTPASDIRASLTHLRNLEKTLMELERQAEGIAGDISRHKTSSLRADVEGLRRTLKSLGGVTLYTEVFKTGTPAWSVFEVPELADNIFYRLDCVDLMSLYGVSRGLRVILDGSPVL